MITEIAKNLRQAANIMKAFGWANGVREARSGAMCVLGAMAKAKGMDPNDWDIDHSPEVKALVRVLNLKDPQYPALTGDRRESYAAAAWSNSSPDQGKSVIEGLCLAADKVELGL